MLSDSIDFYLARDDAEFIGLARHLGGHGERCEVQDILAGFAMHGVCPCEVHQ